MIREFKITDYDGNETLCAIPDGRSISLLFVEILTGDEVVMAVLDNGEVMRFDSSTNRWDDDYDGSYIVKKDDLEMWVSLSYETSYGRKEKFENFLKEGNQNDQLN